MLASSTLLKNVLRPRDLICCWESYLLVLQKVPIFRKLYHLFWNTYICEWWLPTLGCVRKEWNHVDIGKWFPRGFCAHSSPPASSVGMGAKVSAPPGSSVCIPHCGQGDLCTQALPDDCAQNEAAAEWTHLPVSPGNAGMISVWASFWGWMGWGGTPGWPSAAGQFFPCCSCAVSFQGSASL